jgi:hypothetical protein
VVGNVLLFIMAFPTIPNPGPQSDIRLPLFGLVGVVLAITFLLKRPGLAFGAGFGTGLVAETLFMGACTAHWMNPAGTAYAEAASQRRAAAASAESEYQTRAQWIQRMRERGLDLESGHSQVRIAAECLTMYRKKNGGYPVAEDGLWPGVEESCWELKRRQSGESGWRVRYTPTPAGFQVTAGPDPVLKLKGPLLEIDQRGLMLRRETAQGPAYAVGTPVFVITRIVAQCIAKAASYKPKAPSGVLTFHELVFRGELGCYRIQLQRVKEDSGYEPDLPNEANLWIPITGPYVGIRVDDIATIWRLSYVGHGKTPRDGYKLHARPLRFGETGFRNYLLEDGKMYVTWEDRPATTSDPLVEQCELDPNTACDDGRTAGRPGRK